MNSDLDTLKFSEPELTALSGIVPTEVLSGNLYQPHFWGDRSKRFSFLFNQFLLLALTLIISLPLSLLITKQSNLPPDSTQLVYQFIALTGGISSLITIGTNLYMVHKAKPFWTLASLLDEIDQYHDVIRAVNIMDRLVEAGNIQRNPMNRKEVINALTITRESLVCALRTEKILRENKDFMGRRHELFMNIENNLSALMTLDVTNQASEYGQLLNQALEIGMSVHQELKKLR